MSKISQKITGAYVRTKTRLQQGIDRLTEQPESGLDDAAWKAIWITVGAAAAVTLTGVIVVWASNYLNSKLSGF